MKKNVNKPKETFSIDESKARSKARLKARLEKKDLDVPPVACSRCGDCCKMLPLGYSIEFIRANEEAFQRRNEGHEVFLVAYTDKTGNRRHEPIFPALAEWSSSLVYHTHEEALQSGLLREHVIENISEYSWFSCSHLVKEEVSQEHPDGLYSCGIHEDRPDVCSKYTPFTQGGYLKAKSAISHLNCSYLKEFDLIEAVQSHKASNHNSSEVKEKLRDILIDLSTLIPE